MWNKEIEFEKIRAHLREAAKQCLINEIPIFWCAAVSDDGEETKYVMDGVTPCSMGLTLSKTKSDGTIESFKSDFRLVAEFFKAKRLG